MADGDVAAWFNGIPPVTRLWFTGSFALTVAANFGLVSPYKLLLDFSPIIHYFQVRRGA
jgi:hypothetical protein